MSDMTPMMLVHIILGAVAILSGFLGLLSKKGQQIHRTAGKVFVFSMLIMAITGSIIAYQKPEMVTFLAGLFTSYLVLSALITVRNTSALYSWQGILLAVYALCIGVAGIYYGYQASQSADNLLDGFPATPYFFFGGLALLTAVLDLKILMQKSIVGVHKIARHSWRMSFALLMATSSLFDGPGAKTFPEALQGSSLLLLPQLVVAVLLFYWPVRILYFNKVSRCVEQFSKGRCN